MNTELTTNQLTFLRTDYKLKSRTIWKMQMQMQIQNIYKNDGRLKHNWKNSLLWNEYIYMCWTFVRVKFIIFFNEFV